MKIAPALALAVVGFGAAGYFVSRHTLDTADFDAKLKDWVEDHYARVDRVGCPSVKMKKGATFRCHVHFNGGDEHDLAVEQVDDAGLMHYHFDPPIMLAEKVAAGIVIPGKKVVASCGKGIVVIPATGYRCDVTVDGEPAHMLLTADLEHDSIVWRAVP